MWLKSSSLARKFLPAHEDNAKSEALTYRQQ
jgi:hypothetical protein